MKTKLLKVVGSSLLLTISLASCGQTNDPVLTMKALDIPTNVKLVEGEDRFSSADDAVSFDAVEGATKYYVYVYQNGDTLAKVTSGTNTTVELPTPLAAGVYNIRVVAVGDGVNTKNSNGSEAISYDLKEATITKLSSVSNLAVDFKTDTLTFKGDANASNYTVAAYKSNAEGEKGDLVTNFKVPGSNDANVSYAMPTAVTDDLSPGYYIFDIQAMGDVNQYTSDSDVFTSAKIINGGYDLATPVANISEADNGGIKIDVTNCAEAFAYGQEFTVQVYTDAACTQAYTTSTFKYTQKTMPWGSDNTSGTIEVKEADAAAANELAVGVTYYIRVAILADGVIYNNSVYSEAVALTPSKAGTGASNNGGNGGPGGSGS